MPSSILEEAARDGTATESDRQALLNVTGYAGCSLRRCRQRLPPSPLNNDLANINDRLFTFDAYESGLDEDDLVWLSERSLGYLSIPKHQLFAAMLVLDGRLSTTSIKEQEKPDFWSQLKPGLTRAIVSLCEGMELAEGSLEGYIDRFLRLIRRIYLVGASRRLNDQAALASAGGEASLLAARGFHHPTLASKIAPTGTGSRPLREDIQREQMDQDYDFYSDTM